MVEKIYMAVTADKYELPIKVSKYIAEIAEWAGKEIRDIHSAIYRKSIDYNQNCKYVSVNIITKIYNNEELEYALKERRLLLSKFKKITDYSNPVVKNNQLKLAKEIIKLNKFISLQKAQ